MDDNEWSDECDIEELDNDESNENNNSADDEKSDEMESKDNNEVDDKTLINLLKKINKIKNLNKNKNSKEFLLSVKRFLKAALNRKSKLYNKLLVNKLTYMNATNVAQGKIEISLTVTKKYFLKKITSKKFSQQDFKILLIDFLLSSCLSTAVKLIEKYKGIDERENNAIQFLKRRQKYKESKPMSSTIPTTNENNDDDGNDSESGKQHQATSQPWWR